MSELTHHGVILGKPAYVREELNAAGKHNETPGQFRLRVDTTQRVVYVLYVDPVRRILEPSHVKHDALVSLGRVARDRRKVAFTCLPNSA